MQTFIILDQQGKKVQLSFPDDHPTRYETKFGYNYCVVEDLMHDASEGFEVHHAGVWKKCSPKLEQRFSVILDFEMVTLYHQANVCQLLRNETAINSFVSSCGIIGSVVSDTINCLASKSKRSHKHTEFLLSNGALITLKKSKPARYKHKELPINHFVLCYCNEIEGVIKNDVCNGEKLEFEIYHKGKWIKCTPNPQNYLKVELEFTLEVPRQKYDCDTIADNLTNRDALHDMILSCGMKSSITFDTRLEVSVGE